MTLLKKGKKLCIGAHYFFALVLHWFCAVYSGDFAHFFCTILHQMHSVRTLFCNALFFSTLCFARTFARLHFFLSGSNPGGICSNLR